MRLSIVKRRFWFSLAQAGVIVASVLAAFELRFDLGMPAAELGIACKTLALAIATKIPILWTIRGTRAWNRFIDLETLLRVLGANALASTLFAMAGLFIFGAWPPLSIYLTDFLICFLLSSATGAALWIRAANRTPESSGSKRKRLLIYGAGAAGHKLLCEVRSNPALGYEVVGFLDDDQKKRKTRLMGSPVLGSGREAPLLVDYYQKRSTPIDEIVIAMPSASGREMKDALASCRAAGVACKTLPGINELLSGQHLSSQIRDLKLEDLLGREPVKLEDGRVQHSLRGRSILVTGGAGSIGSELCRQIGLCRPEKLVILDQAESELFKLEMELRQRFPNLVSIPEVGDIRDAGRMEELLTRHSVGSIFHAAAYKHVPLMEAHILEAVKNNVIGTWNLVWTAHRCGVANFLMISSDKAVNPTSVMGVTKRIAEMIVSAKPPASTANPPHFVSVRFGNVLGSNGSVVPLFQNQIASGGPVTVTHPEMRRYFMTIHEAVQLVLQASTLGSGAEIFVLDMGEPVRIVDLAENMIRLMGFVPNEDIEIHFVGIRPGEKLFEELVTGNEDLLSTNSRKIKVLRPAQNPGFEELEAWLTDLEILLQERDANATVKQLKKLVPEYRAEPEIPHLPSIYQDTSFAAMSLSQK
jgi:FlaA1/EpsC-like NDP-sugar epimerase